DLLISDVLPGLRELTDIDLYETVDATCAKYDYTDVLLCHDDELEGSIHKLSCRSFMGEERW
uniref:Uncharacterized protein n=1 Tax=Amphimedon queenslandica TaxID=400682 RepID=A0A1X7SKB8_AMPQE